VRVVLRYAYQISKKPRSRAIFTARVLSLAFRLTGMFAEPQKRRLPFTQRRSTKDIAIERH
jgi:hypothetical protein